MTLGTTYKDLAAARNWLTLCGGALLDLGNGEYGVYEWADACDIRSGNDDFERWKLDMARADYDETAIAASK